MITVFEMASGQQEATEVNRAEVAQVLGEPPSQALQLRLLTLDEAIASERRTRPD